MIVEDTCNLSPVEIKFLEYVLGDNIPWFRQHVTDNYNMFAHVLSRRDPEEKEIPGVVNSAYYDICYQIFKNFCDSHNVPVSVVYRAAINCSEHSPDVMTDIHTDHPTFEHKNFLMYLNDFNEGPTYLFDDDHNLTYTVVPEKYKAVVFSGQNHSNGFCKPGERRVVLVFTFN
jgi:hypothetical protein